MAKSKEYRRLVVRFSLYIEALGGVPTPYRGQSLQSYSVELQQQYEALRHQLGSGAARAARMAGRALIRRHGFAQAGGKFLPAELSKPKKCQLNRPPKSRTAEHPASTKPKCSGAISKREQYNCRRKFRHFNLLSALLHARRLQDDDIHIYPCVVCDGLHVGHDPSAAARRRRQALTELRGLDEKIVELDRTRTGLLKRRDQLMQTVQEESL